MNNGAGTEALRLVARNVNQLQFITGLKAERAIHIRTSTERRWANN